MSTQTMCNLYIYFVSFILSSKILSQKHDLNLPFSLYRCQIIFKLYPYAPCFLVYKDEKVNYSLSPSLSPYPIRPMSNFLKIQLHLLSIGMTPRTKVTLTVKMQSPKGNVSTKQNQ